MRQDLRPVVDQEALKIFDNEPKHLRKSAFDALCQLRLPLVRTIEIGELEKAYADRNAEPLERLLKVLAEDPEPQVAEQAAASLRRLAGDVLPELAR